MASRYVAAYEAIDANGCAELFTSDALLLSPWNAPVRGKKAIAAVHIEWFAEGETDKKMVVDELHIDGNVGFCLMRYKARIPPERQVFGVSVNTLLRQPNGHWKIRHCCITELQDNKTGFTT